MAPAHLRCHHFHLQFILILVCDIQVMLMGANVGVFVSPTQEKRSDGLSVCGFSGCCQSAIGKIHIKNVQLSLFCLIMIQRIQINWFCNLMWAEENKREEPPPFNPSFTPRCCKIQDEPSFLFISVANNFHLHSFVLPNGQ